MKKILTFICLMLGGIFAAKALSPLSYLGSSPDNGETISTFENIVLKFDLDPIIEELGEAEWGIGYTATYNAKINRSYSAYLFKGEQEDDVELAVSSTSLTSTDENFQVGNEILLSFPGVEVEPEQLYTIVVQYQVYAMKKGVAGQYAINNLRTSPIVFQYTGAATTQKTLGIDSYV